MAPNDSGNNKNPWGRPSGGSGGGGRGPWGGGGSSGGGPGGGVPPELDEMLRQAQSNLRQVIPGGFHGMKLFGLIAVGAAGLWLSSGFYIITPGIHGVIQQFGKLSRVQTNEGLGYHLPWPIETIAKVPVSEVRSLQIAFQDPYNRNGTAAESLMLTSDGNIVDLDMVVQWNIKAADDYLFNIRDPENTLRRVAESAIREVVGQSLMFSLITQERESVAQKTREIMSRILDEYKSGINIDRVLIQRAEVHPDVQDAFQDVQSAKQDAVDAQNRAGAYREDIIPKARGEATRMRQEAMAYKESVVARAKGDAARFNSIYEAYKSGTDITRTRLYLETMEDVFKNAQKIIIDDKATGSGVVPYLPLNEMKPASGGSSPERRDTGASSAMPRMPAAIGNSIDGEITR